MIPVKIWVELDKGCIHVFYILPFLDIFRVLSVCLSITKQQQQQQQTVQMFSFWDCFLEFLSFNHLQMSFSLIYIIVISLIAVRACSLFSSLTWDQLHVHVVLSSMSKVFYSRKL